MQDAPYFDVVILGAGLTALSFAYHLEKKGFFNYQIFEKEAMIGGLLKSIKAEGFVFDHTGHFLHSSSAEFTNFLDETIGLQNCNKIQRSSKIWFQNKLIPYPFQHNIKHLDPDVAFECFEGFINRNQDLNPKSFFDWVIKFYGEGFAKHFFVPYNEKLLNIDSKELSFNWTSRFVPDLTLRQLFNSLKGNDSSNLGYNATFLYPKKGGIFSLIQSIANSLSNKIETKKASLKLDLRNKTIFFADGSFAKYKLLVSTIPLSKLLEKIINPCELFIQAQSNLRCNSVYNFNLGIKKKINSPAHWIYFPEREFLFYRLGFWHKFAKEMAPSGCSSIYGEISFLPNQKTSIKKSVDYGINQLKNLFGFQDSDIIVRKDLILPHAYVTYDFWRQENLPSILEELQKNDVLSIGRFGAWKYSSMQEAFFDGYELAKKIT